MLQGGQTGWKAFLCTPGQLLGTAAARGRVQSPAALLPAPRLLWPSAVPEPPAVGLSASDQQQVRKTCKEKEMGPAWSEAAVLRHDCLRKPLLVALFSAQQRKRKVVEAQGLSSSGISSSNDKHMELCPARAHPPVQILGQVTWCLASSFKRLVFIYSSQEFGALFFNLPTSFTSSCSACSPRVFFFAINTPSSGWLLH